MRSDLRNFYCATKQQILKCSQRKHYANNKTVQELHNTHLHILKDYYIDNGDMFAP